MALSNVILGFVVLWLCVITGIVIWIYRFFRRISQNINQGNLTSLLSSLKEKEEENSKRVDSFAKEIQRFENIRISHMQKFGFVRFNPFNDMGGDQSFSLALLDGRDTGFVLTGLHTRERTRVYVKYIKRGKSEYELSKEEGKALETAFKNV